MERLLVESPFGGGEKEVELAGRFVSFTLEEKRLRIFEDCRGKDLLLIRGRRGYVYCGSSGCSGRLNERRGIQKRLVEGDLLTLGGYRMTYRTVHGTAQPPVARAGFRDWALAVACAVLVPVVAWALSLLVWQ